MDPSPEQIDAVLAVGTGLVILLATIWALNGNGKSRKERQAINGMMVRVSDDALPEDEPAVDDRHAPPGTSDTDN